MRLVVAAVSLASLVLAALAPGDSGPAAFSGNNGRIAYITTAGRGYVLSTIAADGSRLRRLSTSQFPAQDVQWSPDGRSLVYTVVRDNGEHDLRFADANGRLRRVVTSVSLTKATWSHDGSRLVAVGFERLYIISPSGRILRRLTEGTRPQWSPDGGRIAFERGLGALENAIFVLELPSGRVRRLTRPATGHNSLAGWSPDGRRIAFSTNSDGIVDPDTGDILSATHVMDVRTRREWRRPRFDQWSPDGRSALYFENDHDGAIHMSVRNLSASKGIEIAVAAPFYGVDWQPLCTIYGTERSDLLVGSDARDVICGLGGDDIVRGRGGDDVIIGGAGDDCLIGGTGADWLFGADGRDLLDTSSDGRDIADGGPGLDRGAIGPVDVTRDVESPSAKGTAFKCSAG